MNAWLSELKVGDKVTVVPGGIGGETAAHEGIITGETKTRWKVGETAFLKSTGKEVGASGWTSCRIEPYDSERIRCASEARKRRSLARKLSDYRWGSMSLEQLRRVAAFVNEIAKGTLLLAFFVSAFSVWAGPRDMRLGGARFQPLGKQKERQKKRMAKPIEQRPKQVSGYGEDVGGPLKRLMTRYGTHRYQYFPATNISWTEAQKRCEAMGGHLATVDSEKENLAVYNCFMDSACTRRAWIGGADQQNVGRWEWVDNSMWRYRHWSEGRKLSKSDVRKMVAARGRALQQLAEAKAKRDELVAEAEEKRDKLLERAKGKKQTYVDRARKKGETLVWNASEKGDALVEAASNKWHHHPDFKYLNNSVGNYLYMLRGARWNARHDSGGWLTATDMPEDAPINGFVCEWESEVDVKGWVKDPKAAGDDRAAYEERRKQQNKRFVEMCKKFREAEQAKVSPSGKYRVRVTEAKSGRWKVFVVASANVWEARQMVARKLNASYRERGVSLPRFRYLVEFAE